MQEGAAPTWAPAQHSGRAKQRAERVWERLSQVHAFGGGGGGAQRAERGASRAACTPAATINVKQQEGLKRWRGCPGAYMDIWEGTEEGGCVPEGADAVACRPAWPAASPAPLDLRESTAVGS